MAGSKVTPSVDGRAQEADVILAVAHYTQAAARMLPEGNDARGRLELLAANLAKHGRERLPKGEQPLGVA